MTHITAETLDAIVGQLERNIFPVASPNNYIVIRLDGISFSKYTRNVCQEKPFDSIFNNAMSDAARACQARVNALFTYVQSDEITLVIAPTLTPNSAHIYGGRTHKIITDMASLASVYFDRHMFDCSNRAKMMAPGNFDGRCFITDSLDDVILLLYSRVHSCYRNIISMAATEILSSNARHGVSTRELIAALAAHNTPIEQYSDRIRFGEMLVRSKIAIPPNDPRWNDVPTAHRPTEPVIRAVLNNHTPRNVNDYNAFQEECMGWIQNVSTAP